MFSIARTLWRVSRSRHLSLLGASHRAEWITHGGSRERFDEVRSEQYSLRYFSSSRDAKKDSRRTTPVRELVHRSSGVKEDSAIHDTVSAWNVANAVTLGRIVAAPLTGYWIVTGDYNSALGGLLYAGASDWLDGHLARRLQLRTVIGSYLDPAADKLLISITTICLAYQDVIPHWLALLIIGRDAALVLGWAVLLRGKVGSLDLMRAYHVGVTRAIEPHFISKLNTAMQLSLSFAGVISAGEWGLVGAPTVEAVGIATALTTTTSGLSYGREYLRQRSRHG